MRKIASVLTVILGLCAGLRAQEALESKTTQETAAAIVKRAQTAIDAIDDGEPGDVTDAEASRPATKVSEGVWRSSRLNAVSADHLYDLGVRTVLNLEGKDQFKDERRLLDEARARRAAAGKPSWRIESVNVHMSGVHPPSFWQLDEALDVMADGARRPVLVHCKHGEDRTGVTVASFRVDVEKSMSIEDAVTEAKSFHCCHLVIPGEHGLFHWLHVFRWHGS